ncbi:MAG TPA: helix-turn-helix domain-containing protein [Planctomycetota bacterium]|nr:helix-turn-helix domain-containing protein [Planctomycetota bacterium]
MTTVRFDRKSLPKDETDWKALRKLSEDEVERRALLDPDARPLTKEDFKRLKRSPRVRIVRMALGLTQEDFAKTYGIPVATLRDWEQGRRKPDQASKTLLKLIERIPHEVRVALATEKRSGTRG